MQNKLPSISILVMSYNQEAYIGDCVDSVLAQEYDGELEFIFCDDNSSDSTFSIIQEKVYQYTGNRRIITLRNPSNLKVAASMNNAVSHSKGEWLMRMDGDDIMHPDRVRLTAEAISKYPQATAVCGRYQHFSHNIQPLTNPELHNLQYEVHNYKHFTELTKPEALEWWGGIMCMKRSIFDTFGPMPHDCDVLDDTMFATRALMLGDFVSMTNAILIYYRRHDNNVSSTPSHSNSIKAYLKADSEMRDYYRRGIHCHTPILQEVQQYTDKHPECKTLLLYFENRFKELSRQGNFWRKSWSERIADAHIQGPFWRKIPWAIRVFSPFTYALAAKFMKKS